ncbi:MAG: hypothetical protein PF589_05390 [Gammaproteobacteria bacterium]|jgi:predicted transcriptional regulator|nr:hypothetical protein [Gammaproteobacteria bacterium]
MSSGNFEHALFSQFARVGKTMSSVNHLELLEFLAQGECSVDELAKVAGRKQRLKVYYSLGNDDVITLFHALHKVARVKQKSLKARGLEEGFTEWKIAGLLVER